MTRCKLAGVGPSTVPVTSTPRRVEVELECASRDTLELPTFNPKVTCKPFRYIHGVSDRGNSTFLDGLLEFDSETRTTQAWMQHAHSLGEGVFVPNSEGSDEDDGVLLSVVLDGKRGKSYLLVLDPKSFQEVGRAEMDSVIFFWVPW